VGALVLHVHVDLFAVRTSIDLCVPAADCEPEVQSRQVPPSRRLRGRARRIYQERTSSTSCRGRREELRRKDGQRHGRGSCGTFAGGGETEVCKFRECGCCWCGGETGPLERLGPSYGPRLMMFAVVLTYWSLAPTTLPPGWPRSAPGALRTCVRHPCGPCVRPTQHRIVALPEKHKTLPARDPDCFVASRAAGCCPHDSEHIRRSGRLQFGWLQHRSWLVQHHT
jgi:hypothetical protein